MLGFVGSDLIYGFARQEDVWSVNGRVQEIPMYVMYIADSEMNIESEYRKDGIYISDVVTEDGRIHLKRLVKLGTISIPIRMRIPLSAMKRWKQIHWRELAGMLLPRWDECILYRWIQTRRLRL